MAVSQQIRQSASDLSQTVRSSHSNAQFPMWVSEIKYVFPTGCSSSQAADSRARKTKQRLQNTLVDLLVVVCWLL